MAGTNTYTGGTTISAGTLALGNGGSIAASSRVADAGTFDISASGGASIQTLSGAGTVALGANTLTLTNQSSTFSGGIAGTGGLTLTGAGTETLTGVDGYTGATTINSGTLALGANGQHRGVERRGGCRRVRHLRPRAAPRSKPCLVPARWRSAPTR